MPLHHAPKAKVQMLIRRPVSQVFEAFVDPAITCRFWFTRSSGPLEAGAELVWEWEMYGASAPVRVFALEPDQRILIEWGDPPCPVEWTFSAQSEQTTLVTITAWGFVGDDDQTVAQAIDAMGGFSFVLAGLKAYLEHGISLNLVADHVPAAQ